ncbi:MAG: hypothetical protein AAGC55_05290 [Myxococcota bacterium]
MRIAIVTVIIALMASAGCIQGEAPPADDVQVSTSTDVQVETSTHALSEEWLEACLQATSPHPGCVLGCEHECAVDSCYCMYNCDDEDFQCRFQCIQDVQTCSHWCSISCGLGWP